MKFSAAMKKSEFTEGEETSRSFSLSAANRSLALVRLDRHQAALEDIELALESGYPEQNRYKLLERKGKCLIQLGQYRQAEQCFKKALGNLSTTGGCDKERLKSRQNIEKELETLSRGEA